MNQQLIATDVAFGVSFGVALSRDVPMAAGFLCDKYVVLTDRIKDTFSTYP